MEPDVQGRGCGKALVEFLIRTYTGWYVTFQVGTGDSPSTIPVYESCGFHRSHLVKNFFTDHYDHPIYEGGCSWWTWCACKEKYEKAKRLRERSALR